MTIALHNTSKQHFDSLEKLLPQVVLLTGPVGVGLKTIAVHLAGKRRLIRVITPQLLTKNSTIPQIGIGTIRELYDDTRSKTTDQQVVVIDDADMMTLSAQNSFLKLLEEPGRNVRFILTSHRPERLLPTVRSRSQTFYFAPLSRSESEQFMESSVRVNSDKLAKLTFVAEGLPAEIIRLVDDNDYFDAMVRRMTLAKRLLESDSYGRLAGLLGTRYDRAESLALLTALATLLTRHPQPDHSALLAKLLEAYERIENGGNVRLQIAAAMV